MLEQVLPHIRNQRCRQPGVPPLVPDRDDRGEDAGYREHAEDRIKRLEIFFAERIIDQEFQAQRHEDIEERLDHDAEADECQYFLVVLQKRLDERIDRRQRAGRFLRGKDNEILVFLIVVNIEIVIIFVIVIGRGRRSRLAADDAICGVSVRRRLLVQFRRDRISRGSGYLIIRRWRLGRHKTNRCGTAGMTAKSRAAAERTTARILCDWHAFSKATAKKFLPVVPVFAETTFGWLSRRRRPCQRTSSAGCRSPHTTDPAPCWRPASPPRARRCSRGDASTGRSGWRRTAPTIPTRCRAS